MATTDTAWSKKIKRFREEKGWSQENLAEKIGPSTNQNTISRWENGITKPNPYYRQRLSEVLGKSIEELGFLEKIDEKLSGSEPIGSGQVPPITQTLTPFFRRRNVIISLVMVGVVIAGGLIYVFSISHTETVTFPLTAGSNGATTKYTYSGTVTIKVSGAGQASGEDLTDAFYVFTVDKGRTMVTPYRDSISLCINNKLVDNFMQAIPVPSTSHAYTFQINAPGGQITFGICDDVVSDNTGSFTVTISQGIFALFT